MVGVGVWLGGLEVDDGAGVGVDVAGGAIVGDGVDVAVGVEMATVAEGIALVMIQHTLKDVRMNIITKKRRMHIL